MASTETDLDKEFEYKRRELRWVRQNPGYLLKIGLDPWRKEQELVVEVAFLQRLKRLRKMEHEEGEK